MHAWGFMLYSFAHFILANSIMRFYKLLDEVKA